MSPVQAAQWQEPRTCTPYAFTEGFNFGPGWGVGLFFFRFCESFTSLSPFEIPFPSIFFCVYHSVQIDLFRELELAWRDDRRRSEFPSRNVVFDKKRLAGRRRISLKEYDLLKSCRTVFFFSLSLFKAKGFERQRSPDGKLVKT